MALSWPSASGQVPIEPERRLRLCPRHDERLRRLGCLTHYRRLLDADRDAKTVCVKIRKHVLVSSRLLHMTLQKRTALRGSICSRGAAAGVAGVRLVVIRRDSRLCTSELIGDQISSSSGRCPNQVLLSGAQKTGCRPNYTALVYPSLAFDKIRPGGYTYKHSKCCYPFFLGSAKGGAAFFGSCVKKQVKPSLCFR